MNNHRRPAAHGVVDGEDGQPIGRCLLQQGFPFPSFLWYISKFCKFYEKIMQLFVHVVQYALKPFINTLPYICPNMIVIPGSKHSLFLTKQVDKYDPRLQ